MVFAKGTNSIFVTFVAMAIVALYAITKGRKYKITYLRRVAGLDAIEDALGRSTEMGKPVLFGTGGYGEFGGASSTSSDSDQLVASLELLRWVASKVAKYKTELYCSVAQDRAVALHQDVIEEGYKQAGSPELFKPENVRWSGGSGWARYALSSVKDLYSTRPAACIQMGPASMDTTWIQDTARSIGAITITGTGRLFSIPLAFITSDYSLWGDELISAAAYLSNEPTQHAFIRGCDLAKLFSIALVVVALILIPFGIKLGDIIMM